MPHLCFGSNSNPSGRSCSAAVDRSFTGYDNQWRSTRTLAPCMLRIVQPAPICQRQRGLFLYFWSFLAACRASVCLSSTPCPCGPQWLGCPAVSCGTRVPCCQQWPAAACQGCWVVWHAASRAALLLAWAVLQHVFLRTSDARGPLHLSLHVRVGTLSRVSNSGILYTHSCKQRSSVTAAPFLAREAAVLHESRANTGKT